MSATAIRPNTVRQEGVDIPTVNDQHWCVRITVELDDESASRLDKEARRLGFSVAQAVNYFLRVGLDSLNRQQKKVFKVTPFKLGLPPGLSYDCVAELIEYLEGPYHL